MQNPELIAPGFVLCTDRQVVSTSPLESKGETPVTSYKVVQVRDSSFFHVGDRVVASGEGALIKLRGNSTEYWMFDVNALVGKLTGEEKRREN